MQCHTLRALREEVEKLELEARNRLIELKDQQGVAAIQARAEIKLCNKLLQIKIYCSTLN